MVRSTPCVWTVAILPVLVVLLSLPSPARAQDAEATALAVRAAEVHGATCGNLKRGKGSVGAVTDVATAWKAVDAYLQAVPQPVLLYWRGLLSECLGDPAASLADLRTFVESAALLDRIRNGQSGEIRPMLRDAERRVKRLAKERESSGRNGAAEDRAVRAITRTEKPRGKAAGKAPAAPWVALTVGGAAASALGFVLNGVTWQQGTQATEEADYGRIRTLNHLTFGVGIGGAATAVLGGVGLGAVGAKNARVGVAMGPVTRVVVVF